MHPDLPDDPAPTQPEPAPVTPRKPPGATWPFDYEGEFNMPLLGVGLTILFVGAAIHAHLTEDGPVDWSWMAVTLGVLFGGPSLLQLWEQYRDLRFRRFILAEWPAIASGRAVLDGTTIGPDTELVRYPVVVSLLAIHSYMLGRPVLPGTTEARRARRASLITAAVAGWWFLPHGPLRTIGALRTGLTDRPARIRLADVANATLQARPLDEVHTE